MWHNRIEFDSQIHQSFILMLPFKNLKTFWFQKKNKKAYEIEENCENDKIKKITKISHFWGVTAQNTIKGKNYP